MIKSCLHDWPTNEATIILKRIAEAMTPGYSKLLILENVLPETGVPFQTATLDVVLMLAYASMERTEEQWRGLTSAAGLEITNIYRRPDGDAAIIAELKA